MNKLVFNLQISKTQYDLYKYKITDTVTYSKRKVYRYSVNDVIYNLRAGDGFKFMYNLLIKESDWKTFQNKTWETYLHELDLYNEIIEHIKGFTEFNQFKNIKLPEDLGIPNLSVSPKSSLDLIIDWFQDPKFKPTDKQVYWVIFHRE